MILHGGNLALWFLLASMGLIFAFMRCWLAKTNKRGEEQSGDERPAVSARALSLPPVFTMPYYTIPHHTVTIQYHTKLYPYHTTILHHYIPSYVYHDAMAAWTTDMPHALIERFPHSRTLRSLRPWIYANLNSNFPPPCFGTFDFS